MTEKSISELPVAIRIFPETEKPEKPTRKRKPWSVPRAWLVFDTETRTDAAQGLTFGSYRFIVGGETVEEGLFYGDDLPDKDRTTLEQYVADHKPNPAFKDGPQLLLMSRGEFVDRFYLAAYKGHCLVIAFNLPFDLSRIGCDFTDARGQFAGGFSLGLWTYVDSSGVERLDKFRPSLKNS